MIPLRLLIVEDEENVRYIFRQILGDIPSSIAETDSLTGAMHICATQVFDIILLDLILTDASKDKTIQSIPELKRTSGASIVVVTGVTEPDIEEQVLRVGADFYVNKDRSFSKAILLALHAAILKRPNPHPGEDYLAHVSMLERLVHAA